MPADSIPNGDSASGQSNAPEHILSTSPAGSSTSRVRTDSESSEKIARFILPSVDGSPPKVLTLNEVADVFKNIQNMELAHEIALNPEFKLLPYEPPENSLERRIKDIMHKAFWDVLREQLQQNPPCYDHAIQLLADIKECFPQILSPNNTRVLAHINEVLDAEVIRQQAEKGLLDFKAYANFVIQIMSRSCAPARDEAVKQLAEIDDVVDTFKGILETMTLMKLDMANYLLDHARNDILANSVEYEKAKFKEYLEYYKFGFPATENWLKRNFVAEENDPNNSRAVERAINNAYMDLMDWNDEWDFPEVLSMDKERMIKLNQRAKRLCLCASLISICQAIPIISQRSENRIALAKQFEILLQDASNDSEIAATMENVWLQAKTVINGYLEKEAEPPMDEKSENLIQSQILLLRTKDAPVRVLMWNRLKTYFRLTMRAKGVMPPPPPGFVDYQDEIESYASALKRVIAYNHSVFGEYFLQILKQAGSTTANPVNEVSEGATAIEPQSEPNTSNDASLSHQPAGQCNN